MRGRNPSIMRHVYKKHDENDCDELQADTPAHQFLAQVRALPPRKRPKPQQQNDKHGRNRNRRQVVEYRLHKCSISVLRLPDKTFQGPEQTPSRAQDLKASHIRSPLGSISRRRMHAVATEWQTVKHQNCLNSHLWWHEVSRRITLSAETEPFHAFGDPRH